MEDRAVGVTKTRGERWGNFRKLSSKRVGERMELGMWRNQLVGDILADSRMVAVTEVGPGGCLVVCVPAAPSC